MTWGNADFIQFEGCGHTYDVRFPDKGVVERLFDEDNMPHTLDLMPGDCPFDVALAMRGEEFIDGNR